MVEKYLKKYLKKNIFKKIFSSIIYMPRISGKSYQKKSKKQQSRRTAQPKGSFKKNVLKVIKSQAEDKVAFASQTTTNYNGTIDSTGEFYDIMPSIGQGTDISQRLGDQIQAKYMTIKGHLAMSLTTDTDANSRIAVRLMILTNKYAPSANSVENNTGLDRLLLANSTAQKFNGDVVSLYLPINRDLWTVHYDKVHYLSISQLYHSSATDIEVTRDTRYTTKFFSIKIPCKRILKFGDGLTAPVNFRPRFALGYAHVDGSTADTVETQVSATWISKLVYEDY